METIINLFYYFLVFLVEFNLVFGTITKSDKGASQNLYKSAVSEFTHHEVVYPTLYKNGKETALTWTKNGHPEKLTVKFQTTEEHFSISLVRNKHLFSKAYVEKSYGEGEKVSLKRPHHKKLGRHCFYHGHVDGAAHSMVALSTCNGVSGYIERNGEVFHIEPAQELDKTSHRLYKDVHSVYKPLKCGAHREGHSTKKNETQQIEHKYKYFKRRRRSIIEPYDSNGNTRYVEMYVVNDVRTFESNSRLLDYQIGRTQNIINIVSRLYQPFNVYIALVGIENWTREDRFKITTEADTTLENFLHYRKNRINEDHPNDNAQLITDTTFSNGVVGKAIKGTICTFQYSGGVNLNLATEGQTATTIAHELGHNFGMDHDNYTVCKCRDDKCIMAATSGGVNTPTKWSSCSMLALQEAFEMGMDYCLRNVPEKLDSGPVCGNGFTEEGEECDCGMAEDCRNRCCDARTCKLTPGAQCATGTCCDISTCKVKEAATLCRGSKGECDLPEFCNGSTAQCPPNVYVQDGVDCHDGQSYCFNGTCKTHTGQCKLLWGTTGRVSDPVCFKHLNINGSKHGNCGYNWITKRYVPCLRDDVMCGLLHCVHQNEKLMFWKDNLAHATPATFLTIGATTYVCRGATLDVGLDMPDPGMVPDGSKCGDQKMCFNQKCMSISYMKFKTCPGGCTDRGVCNSKGNCHCEEGWGPPTCDIAGNGGSVDSGPIKIESSKSLLIALLVFFLVVVPLLGLSVFIVYYFRHSIQAWWHSHLNKKPKEQNSRPMRPAHAPPKRDPPPPYPNGSPPPPYPKPQNKNPVPSRPVPTKPVHKPKLTVNISNPVLTGSTHKDSQTHVQRSPVPDHKEQIHRPPPPKLPTKAAKPSLANHGANKPLIKDSEKKQSTGESKSKFGTVFKIPSFSKADKPSSPKPQNKNDEPPVGNIVKKRELTRDISNPVLISTTDRRSKHLVKQESFTINQGEDSKILVPPVPPHVSLNRSDSDTARRNRPLPPRPMSMPESECGDDLQIDASEARKSIVGMSQSPRMPLKPPPPPIKPHLDHTRRTIEDELAKLDDIEITVPDDSHDSDSTTRTAAHPKTKDIKPKPRTTVKKSKSDSKKALPVPPSKTGAAKSKSTDTRSSEKPIQKPIFNPKARPGLSNKKQSSAIASKTDKSKSTEPTRKPSTDSLDEDGNSGAASVSGLAKMFEGQKKPLLGDKNVKRTAKVPMTPPKPKAKQIRSIDV